MTALVTDLDLVERLKWMAIALFVAALGNCTSWAGEIYVTPDGRSDGRGTRQSPFDLATATTNSQLIVPGTTVWIGPGTYRVGSLQPHESIHGVKDNPVIYRAMPGPPATVVGEIRPNNDYVWYWGLERQGRRHHPRAQHRPETDQPHHPRGRPGRETGPGQAQRPGNRRRRRGRRPRNLRQYHLP